MRKVIAVGVAPSQSLVAAIVAVLDHAACIEQSNGEMSLHKRPELPAILDAPVPNDDGCDSAWYQRFAGKRGRRPRY